MSPPAESVTLVGRTRRPGRPPRAAAAARSGGTALVVVEGEPGVGKTRLLQELAAGDVLPVVWGRSPDHEAVPALWPWEQVLAAVAVQRPDVPVPEGATALLAGRGDRPPSFDAEGARLRGFETVVAYLRHVTPLAVLLEDLHAADAASLRLLEHVASADVPGLLVVVTYRRHEASHLTSVLARLARAGAERVSLDGLDDGEIRALVTATTGIDPGAEHAAELRARTAGNPYFVTALARDASAIPSSVGDVVRHRVERLGEPAGSVLESAAVIGDEAETWLVAEVCGRSLDETVAALDSRLRSRPGHERKPAVQRAVHPLAGRRRAARPPFDPVEGRSAPAMCNGPHPDAWQPGGPPRDDRPALAGGGRARPGPGGRSRRVLRPRGTVRGAAARPRGRRDALGGGPRGRRPGGVTAVDAVRPRSRARQRPVRGGALRRGFRRRRDGARGGGRRPRQRRPRGRRLCRARDLDPVPLRDDVGGPPAHSRCRPRPAAGGRPDLGAWTGSERGARRCRRPRTRGRPDLGPSRRRGAGRRRSRADPTRAASSADRPARAGLHRAACGHGPATSSL